ncbi:hypothetical protein LC593_34935 [Nostoc sp. CHAB 5844]|nr:hypothetical protein [Nostoc sp. CHAB 5844]
MGKARTTSQVTGLRKLSRDPAQAAAIRACLALELKRLASQMTDVVEPLLVKISPGYSYSFAGGVHRVTPAQVETFGLELVKKDILKDVAPFRDDALLFVPSKQGMIFLAKGNRRVWEAPKAVYTGDVLTRQKPVMKDKVAATTILKPSAAVKQKVQVPPPSRAVRINVSRAIQNIELIEPLKLIALWENAQRILADPNKRDQHKEISAAVSAIEDEWKRRNDSGDRELFFQWPTTELRQGGGEFAVSEAQKDGVLGKLNYRVGISQGQPELYRRRTLANLFEGLITLELPRFEVEQWGSAKSAKRLRKIAYSIATFVKNAKGRNPIALDVAIKQWEADLRFLHDSYYVGRFDFPWPSTHL